MYVKQENGCRFLPVFAVNGFNFKANVFREKRNEDTKIAPVAETSFDSSFDQGTHGQKAKK